MWAGDRTEWVKSGCSSLMAMKFIDMDSNSLCLCSAYRKLYCSLLDINLIYLSFLHCPHSSCPWAFLFILLLDGLVMQPPGKSIDPPDAEVTAQTGATESCSHLFSYWGEMEGSPYFTSCFDKLLSFVVLLFGDLFLCIFPFNLLWGNRP